MRLLLLLSGLLLATTAGADSGTARFPSEEALRQYVQGRMADDRGDDGEAIGAYFRAIALDPDAVSAMLRLSELAARRGEFRRSIEIADRAIAADSSAARAWWLRGAAQFSIGELDRALESCRASVALDSTRVEYWSTLLRVADGVERVDLVRDAAFHVVDLDPDDSEAWFQLASAEARLGRFGAARRALSPAAELAPGRPGIEFLSGWVAEGLREDDEAARAYRRHLEVYPDDGATRRRLVQVLARSRRFAEALPYARTISEGEPSDPEAWEVRAWLEFESHRDGEALASLAKLEALGSDDPENLRRRVQLLAGARRLDEAARLADAWTRRHPGDMRGPLLTARAYAAARQTNSALVAARRAIEWAPDSLAPRTLLAGILSGAERFEEASAAWKDVVERHPGESQARLELAVCEERLGRKGEAERIARDLLGRDSDNATLMNFLGYLLADDNRNLEEAEQLIRKAVELQPENGAFVDSMGWVLYRLGRLENARIQLERAVVLTRDDPTVLEHLGDVYRDLRLPDLARQFYRKAMASEGRNDRIRRKLEGLR